MNDTLALNRRAFLRAGLFGSALLAGGAGVASLSGCSAAKVPADGFLHLRQADIELLTPMIPVLLAGALPNADADVPRVLQRLDTLLDSPAQGGRDAIFQLYDVLQLGAFRWWTMDAWSHPGTLSAEQIDQGLASWSRKQNSFARLAFNGLCQPLTLAWYTDPEIAKGTGYPGPPRKVVA
ncbi:Tat pathway signal protein [Alcanivorax sp. 1008]|uniref:Tat pathway signal protein n=1 Tax=Alcanivorax sp. 1008 TaxID=2816853 RepID=UPI001DFF2CA1|nr:Tat pathway signal protein [Alcanivorax sp. 1008]MCC1496921.1 Tat pathway signal protein [Alcanivorax sp. 1008]